MHQTAMHLAYTTFTEIKRCSNLFHRHFFVVVKNDNESFVSTQTFGDQSQQVVFLTSLCWIFTFLIIQNVDFTDILFTISLIPFLIKPVNGCWYPASFFRVPERSVPYAQQFYFGGCAT